jgi:DNA repair exonuclease SbcCD ATPase subunit
VLQKLDDPLRVRLGDPIRQTGTKIQDIIVMDITDPMENSKHFNLLSGGEQFRVALALALALHRRAAGGVAGTIIVDEGFGALDSDHRDALAQEMADTSGGILRLGLAENIILCSHSSEVQQRFPNRWIVEKRGGTATVLRWKCDDSLISSDEI